MEFRLEVNQDRALNDVKDAIDKIRTQLPRNIDEPIVRRIDVEGQSILTFAASAPGWTLEQLSWHVDDVIKRQLQGLKGVGRVERYGGVDREIRVLLDPDRLLALGVTAADVNAQVRATNVDLGGGRGEVGGQEQAIRTLAGARRVEDQPRRDEDRCYRVPRNRRRRARLVIDGASEQRSFARLDKQPVVTFSVFRSKGGERAVRRRRRQQEARGAADDLSGRPPDEGRRRGRLHPRQLHLRAGDADRGSGSCMITLMVPLPSASGMTMFSRASDSGTSSMTEGGSRSRGVR